MLHALLFLQTPLRLQLVSLLSNAESNSFGCVTGLCFSIRVNAGMPLHNTPQCTQIPGSSHLIKVKLHPNALKIDHGTGEKLKKHLADKQAGFLSYSLRLPLIRLSRLEFQAERGVPGQLRPFSLFTVGKRAASVHGLKASPDCSGIQTAG